MPLPTPESHLHARVRALVVSLTFPLESLADEDLSPAEMFVLSRIGDDRVCIGDLLDVCVPLSDTDVETIVSRMLHAGLLTPSVG